MTPEQQWDKTVGFFLRGSGSHVYWCGVGIMVQPCRYALPGDLLIMVMTNGGGRRHQYAGITSKGRRIHMRYIQYATYSMKRYDGVRVDDRQFDRGPIRNIVLPGELTALSPADPGVRAFVFEAVRARYPALR